MKKYAKEYEQELELVCELKIDGLAIALTYEQRFVYAWCHPR